MMGATKTEADPPAIAAILYDQLAKTCDELREAYALSEAACLIQVKAARAEADDLRQEVEKIERKMKAHRETAVAAIAGTEKLLHAVEAERDELRAEVEKWKDLVKTFAAGNVALEAEVERLRGTKT